MIKGVIYEAAVVSNVKEKKSPANYESFGNNPKLDVAGISERVKGRLTRNKMGKSI